MKQGNKKIRSAAARVITQDQFVILLFELTANKILGMEVNRLIPILVNRCVIENDIEESEDLVAMLSCIAVTLMRARKSVSVTSFPAGDSVEHPINTFARCQQPTRSCLEVGL
jgi:hypothetical protein